MMEPLRILLGHKFRIGSFEFETENRARLARAALQGDSLEEKRDYIALLCAENVYETECLSSYCDILTRPEPF